MNEKKAINWKAVICNLDIVVSALILLFLIVITFTGVITRRVFNSPFTWLEEVQVACMVWIVFGAGGAAFRTGNHVAIEMIVDLFPPKIQKYFEIFIGIVIFLVIGYLFVQSIGYIQLFMNSGRATSILKIPYTLIYGIAPVSYIIMLISYVYSIIKGVKTEAKEAIES